MDTKIGNKGTTSIFMIWKMQGVREKSPRHVLPVCGGSPINEQMATALRQIVFGQCPEPIRAEYFSRGPGLVFREAERELGYGLMIGNAVVAPMIRSLLMIIQGHVLRSLLFHPRPARVSRPSPLRPSKQMQQDALCSALADMFWKAGGGESCTVCLPHPTDVYVQPSDRFNEDGVTERLLLFHYEKYEDVLSLLRRYIYIFQEDPGPALLLIIYSSVLSRRIDRVGEDLGHRHLGKNVPNLFRATLLCYSGKIIFSTLCLLLTGRATPFLHNGIVYEGSEDQCAVAQVGITCRSPLGLLIWMGSEEKTAAYRIGSRLKTPVFPIWICVVADNTGVLFSCDRELMRDYRAENKFDLHYYTSSHHQTSSVTIGITNKNSNPQEAQQQVHPLEKIISTKWCEAQINWNGVTPFV